MASLQRRAHAAETSCASTAHPNMPRYRRAYACMAAMAAQVLLKLGDTDGLLQLHLNTNHWDEALKLIETHPHLASRVYEPYAQWLIEQDRFEEAQVLPMATAPATRHAPTPQATRSHRPWHDWMSMPRFLRAGCVQAGRAGVQVTRDVAHAHAQRRA